MTVLRRPLGYPLSCVALATLLACTRVGTTGSGAGVRHSWTVPNELRAAMSGATNTLNPILSTQEFEAIAESFAFDPLIATDENGTDVPILATEVPTQQNGGIGRNGLTITYHLRHNVRWQDGAPFTSADVKFSVAAIMNPNTAVVTRHGYDDIARVTTPDAYTVVFRLKRPFAPAVDTFFAYSDAPFMILPAHLLARYQSLDNIPFDAKPIGTGPFKIVHWYRGDRIDYVANDDYFLGKPKLRKIEMRYVPDENTIVSELRAHELDWFVLASPRSYPQLKTVPDVRLALVPLNAYDAIMFNTRRAPFDDVRLRRAVGLAIDKARLAQEVTFGTTVAATEDLPSFMWAFNPRAGTSARNLAGANALLDAAGWKMQPDGIRRKDGRRLAMELAYRTDSITDRNRGVVIMSMLRDAGIDVELRGYTTALLYGPAGEGGILSSGRYEAGLQTWYAGVDPDDSSQLLCDQRPPTGYDWSRYCTPAMDAAQHDALTHYDRATRKRAYATIQSLLARDAPLVFLWWPRQIQATSIDLHGFRPNGIIPNWNSYQWSI